MSNVSVGRPWPDMITWPGGPSTRGAVSTTDLLAVLAAWGACQGCVEAFTGDGFVRADEILRLLLSDWS